VCQSDVTEHLSEINDSEVARAEHRYVPQQDNDGDNDDAYKAAILHLKSPNKISHGSDIQNAANQMFSSSRLRIRFDSPFPDVKKAGIRNKSRLSRKKKREREREKEREGRRQ